MKTSALKFIPLDSQADFAVGNDLVFIPEFEKSFNSLFQKKVFTENEIEYCQQFDYPILRYASTWAAKEAVYKSVKQILLSSLPLKKIEIIRTKIAGIPKVVLPESLAHLQVSLSITHDGDYTWAIAICRK